MMLHVLCAAAADYGWGVVGSFGAHITVMCLVQILHKDMRLEYVHLHVKALELCRYLVLWLLHLDLAVFM